MKLSEKEIQSVSKLKPFERYQYLIKKVADFDKLWTVVDDNGDIALSDIEDKTFITFWTAEPFIESNLIRGWKNCKPFKLTLDDLEKTVIPLIEESEYLINAFPVGGKSGFILSLNEFIRDLNEELEHYE